VGEQLPSITLKWRYDPSEIQRAIEALPEEEQAQPATWVADRDSAAWEAEMERDFSPGGAGAALLEKVRRQVRSGKSKPWAQGPRPV
jgi:hypothetical protein